MRSSLPILAGVCLLLGACDKPAAIRKAGPPVLARVGDREIHPADLVAEAERRRSDGRPVPPKDELLLEMVREETLVQQAIARGIDRSPEVARALRSMLVGALTRDELEPAIQSARVESAEIEAFYLNHSAAFSQPEQLRLAFIVGLVPAVAPAEAKAPVRARMEEAKAMADSGPSGFRDAAARYSEHQGSRYRGGELGWITPSAPPSSLPAEVVSAAAALEVGAVSGLIEASGGIYLVSLLERKSGGVQPLAAVESKIRADLLRERQQQLREEFHSKIAKAVGVEIFSADLDSLELPQSEHAVDQVPTSPSNVSN